MTAATGTTSASGDPARSSVGFARRHAALLLGGPGRVTGLDVARGVAVLGMFTAHVGFTTDDFGEVSGWLSLSHGRSSVLFALVAGVSLALVSGGRTPLDGLPALQNRTRVLVRAVLLVALAGLLDLLGTRVLLILGFYAAYFVLALPFLRWRRRDLLLLAGRSPSWARCSRCGSRRCSRAPGSTCPTTGRVRSRTSSSRGTTRRSCGWRTCSSGSRSVGPTSARGRRASRWSPAGCSRRGSATASRRRSRVLWAGRRPWRTRPRCGRARTGRSRSGGRTRGRRARTCGSRARTRTLSPRSWGRAGSPSRCSGCACSRAG